MQLLTYWGIALGAAFVFFFALERLKKWLLLRVQKKAELPFLTLVLLIENGEKTIEGMVRTLMKLPYCQKNGNFHYELLVIDCHSSDQTGAILERMSRLFPNLKIHKAEYCFELEKLAISLAEGEKIVFLDEKYFKKHYLMKQIAHHMGTEKVIDLRKEKKERKYPRY